MYVLKPIDRLLSEPEQRACICDYDGQYDDGLRTTRIANPACPVDHEEGE